MKGPTPLIGQYRFAIDKKNRLFIPSRFRDALQQEKGHCFILTNGLDGCLYLYLPSHWERLLREKLDSLSVKNKGVERAFKRKFFSEAAETPVDTQGRILVPPLLKEYAGLRRTVYVQGIGTRIEIWDQMRWERYYRRWITPSLKRFARELEI
ncbi:MAG: division/cell wall cluster transcriptional repressor MraZ [Elusimicrobia bacterium]|nr:division/cell wall cluster transcriptional repressor MraZ [Elusimicrobiota bacterium]